MCLAGSLGSMAQSKVYNDANAKTRSLGGTFTAVSVSSGITVYLSQGSEASLAASVSDPKWEGRLKTEVVNGTLKIYIDQSGLKGWNTKKINPKVWVSVTSLSQLSCAAGSHVEITGVLKSSSLAIACTSGAYLSGQVESASLTANVSGGAHMKLEGNVVQTTVTASSGASFDCQSLVSGDCTASANSGASVRLKVQKQITASANSGGSVVYVGAATLTKGPVHSGGSVKKAG